MRGRTGGGRTGAELDYLAGRASETPGAGWRGAGGRVQSEMELASPGASAVRADAGPSPAGSGAAVRALRTAFGVAPGEGGPVPGRAGVLSLLSEIVREAPLICVIDDEQWLDRASVQALRFRAVAGSRSSRPGVRDPPAGPELAGLPVLDVGRTGDSDARALLDSALAGPLDERVRDLIVAETQGNPLALLQLPRGLSPAELAGGFGLPGAGPLAGRIEDSFARQLEALPDQTRRLVQLAAADPSGDLPLVWRAAGRLGMPVPAAAPAVEAGLVEFGGRVRFRHPLARSAAYRSASLSDRQRAHVTLAEVTDPQADPDRRAWHRAQAAAGPDEDVAVELERSAGRAQARGGLAAAAAFLERAVRLTADPARHAERVAGRGAGQPAGRRVRQGTGSAGRRRRQGRWMSSPALGWTCCAGRSPLPRAWAATLRRCCSRRPSDSSRSTPAWPARPTSARGSRRCSPGAWRSRRPAGGVPRRPGPAAARGAADRRPGAGRPGADRDGRPGRRGARAAAGGKRLR